MKVTEKNASKRNAKADSLQLNFTSQFSDDDYPDIKDLASRLHFSPVDGRIWLDDSRMILLRTEAFGALRQELIESLGIESARGLLTRMGYLAGSKDAALARK